MGNIGFNPVFTGLGCTDNDLNIAPGSPAIDSGNPDSIYNDVCIPPSQGTVRNDMGALGGPGACGSGDPMLPGEETLAVSLSASDFGEVPLGDFLDLILTIQNTGEESLTGTLDPPSAPFSILISGDVNFTLAAGASRTEVVRFSPTSTGAFGGSLDITSTGGNASIPLSGIGIAAAGPALAVCSTNLDFGSVLVGSSSNLTCTLTNTGTGTLDGTATTTSSFFSVVSGGTFSLGADQSQNLALRFAPSSAGTVEGDLTLSSNGGSATIRLSGTGTQGPQLTVTPTTLPFGSVRVGQSHDLFLTVQNIGGGMLFRNVCVAAPFSLPVSSAFGLTANQSESLTVRFSPTSAGAFDAPVLFTADVCEAADPQPDPTEVLVSGIGAQESAARQAFVANRNSNSVSVIDILTQTVTTEIPVGASPIDLALTPDASKVYVVNFDSHDVSVIDAATLQVSTTIPVGLNPRAITITADGRRAYVANSGSGEDSVSVLNLSTDMLLTTLPVFRPRPSVLALSPDDTTLYVMGTQSRFVGLIDTTSNQVGRLETGEDPVAIDFSSDGQRAFVANQGANTVSILDTTTFPPSKLQDVPVDEAPRSVAVSPDGAKVFVANFLANTITTFEAAVPLPLSPSSSGSSQKGIPQKIDILTETLAILGWEGTWSLQFDPSFPIQLVAVNRTSDNVGILDITTNQATATVPVGTDPEQNAFNTELPQALVTNFGSNELAVVNTDDTTTAFVPVGEAPVDVVFTVQAAQAPKGSLENPQPGSFQSGVGVISGFVCDATRIEIAFNGGTPFEAAYGTSRGDTQSLCGDTNNGFSLLFNWNLLGNGVHTVRALADGVEFANVTITVTTLGEEFATGLSGEYPLNGFPTTEEMVTVRWQTSLQNFILISGDGGGGGSPGVPPRVLENPQPGSFQSGVGIISGFVCDANRIEIGFDGGPLFEAAYGTSRGDTQSACGDTNNGFSLLFNWNLLGNGVHTVRALADGVEFANVTITVTTLGEEFATGLSGEFTLQDFPQNGTETSIQWQQSQQNFIIVDVQ